MSTNLVKAMRFAEFGPPSVLRIEEVAIPEPGQGEALVRVKAAAINPSDIGNVSGRSVNRCRCRLGIAATRRRDFPNQNEDYAKQMPYRQAFSELPLCNTRGLWDSVDIVDY